MESFFSLPLRQFHPKRYRPGGLGTWSGHLPFANDLVMSLRPSLLVELGTHYGESYFGFCQAVEAMGGGCRCFSIDTWEGDEHAGFYGEAVFQDVAEHNRARYSSFSTLLRTTFDLAIEQFAPDSIDLLHIDGLHTYHAVKHDFDTWFPKVKPGGVVLFHDTNVRHADFEVWRLWKELAGSYPHFEFHHWWGLGVLLKPGGSPPPHPFLKLLFEADSAIADQIRHRYNEAADLLEFRERSPEKRQMAADADKPYLQIFSGDVAGGFIEKESVVSNIEVGIWQTHTAEFPNGSPNGLIRIDPVNRPSVTEISDVTVRSAQGGKVMELSKTQLVELPFASGMTSLGSGEGFRYFNWDNDPHFLLQLPTGIDVRAPLSIEVSMRVQFTLEAVQEALDQASVAARTRLEAEGERWRKQEADRQADMSREQNKRKRLEWDYAFAQTQIRHLTLSYTQSRREAERKAIEIEQKDAALKQLAAEIADHRARLEAMLSSLSWKAMAPFRAIAGPFLNSR